MSDEPWYLDPECNDAVHTWFGLSYASYLAVNRSLLQSMPPEWQRRFVQCMEELNDHFSHIKEPRYTVHARDDQGRFVRDPIPHYNRGRTHVPSAAEDLAAEGTR